MAEKFKDFTIYSISPLYPTLSSSTFSVRNCYEFVGSSFPVIISTQSAWFQCFVTFVNYGSSVWFFYAFFEPIFAISTTAVAVTQQTTGITTRISWVAMAVIFLCLVPVNCLLSPTPVLTGKSLMMVAWSTRLHGAEWVFLSQVCWTRGCPLTVSIKCFV